MNYKCTKCGLEKCEGDFPFAKERRHSWCRSCHKVAKEEYRRKFREANPRKKRIAEDILTDDGCAGCSKCGEKLPLNHFQFRKGKPSGQCRLCKTASEKARRERIGIPVKKLSVIEKGKKLCMCCGEMKVIDDFSPSERGLGGVAAYCKPCFSREYGSNREEGRLATAAYRARHPERHKAAHRVRMFEYRTRKKVTADGSVTDALLKALYGQENCHYCGEATAKDKRTIDHRIALANEGTHTAGNLVMACWTCNSSKRDMSEEDFIKRIKHELRS